MAKLVVKYLLEGDGSIPLFIENGGYFSIGEERVGLSVDENIRHVPASVVRMTKADLTARLAGIAFKDINGELLDDAAKAVLLNNWLAQIGLPDLA